MLEYFGPVELTSSQKKVIICRTSAYPPPTSYTMKVSPIGANLDMEEVESRTLSSFRGTTPSHWFRYVDGIWVKIRIQEGKAFMEHLNSVDSEIKFTREDMNENKLPFLNSVIHLEKDGRLNIEVYRKPVHTDQYLLFHSHHPLVHKLGVIRILHHLAENVPTRTEGKLKEHNHIKTTLKSCE